MTISKLKDKEKSQTCPYLMRIYQNLWRLYIFGILIEVQNVLMVYGRYVCGLLRVVEQWVVT